MEFDREIIDYVGESDSERRRRRRRRRKKKKEDGVSAETAQFLLRLLRWGVGALVMFATWAYGFYVAEKLGWGAAIFFPVGVAAMLCVEAALAIPIITVIVVVVAFRRWPVDWSTQCQHRSCGRRSSIFDLASVRFLDRKARSYSH
jgi:hypothetical protein